MCEVEEKKLLVTVYVEQGQKQMALSVQLRAINLIESVCQSGEALQHGSYL